MRHRPAFAASLLAAVFLAGVRAQQDPFERVRDAGETLVHSLRLRAAGLALVQEHRLLHESVYGTLNAGTVMPIASASKWLAVATILTLVDDGTLDLDTPVARYVQEFDRDDKRRVTLRQCLSCTSGLPAQLGERMRGWDMDRFAAEAADTALRTQSGDAFLYGGVGFQVVAVAAERATGQSWHSLFRDRIATPLGMRETRFGTLQPVGGDAGTAELPWVAGGAVSSLGDYARFVRMLVGKGQVDGVRVLSEKSVAEMFRDQVREQVDVHAVALPGEDVRYGLGTWIERLDDGGVRVSDPGAFGFTPWVDLDRGLGGVFAVRDRVQRVLRHLGPVQRAARELVESEAVAGVAETVELRHDGRERRYHLHVPPHDRAAAGLPLLLVLHGGGGNGAQVRESTRLDELGVQQGFVVAFPDGTGRLPKRLLTWNSGGIDVYASREKVDDVGFLRAVVGDVQQRVPIDTRRVFVVGHSNGGMMCHRLAREAADVFTGIAVVAGAMNWTEADAASPLAVLLIHGTADEHVHIGGGAATAGLAGQKQRVDASLQSAIDYYVERNRLVPVPRSVEDGAVRIDTFDRPSNGGVVAPVRVVTLAGGGHAWPGATVRPTLLSDEPFDWPASRAVVEWFASLEPVEASKQAPPSVPR